MLFYIVELDEIVEVEISDFFWNHRDGVQVRRYAHLSTILIKEFVAFEMLIDYTAVYIGEL